MTWKLNDNNTSIQYNTMIKKKVTNTTPVATFSSPEASGNLGLFT
jgi:hypothetical protein